MKKFLKQTWDFKISGINLPVYLILLLILFLAIISDKLPTGIIGALMILMLLGNLLNFIGNKVPIVKSYLGGGAVLCVFAASAIASFSLLPIKSINIVNNFMNTSGTGFLDFYISALIIGSILGMERGLLVKSFLKFLPVAFIAMFAAMLMAGLVAMISGYGFGRGILYIAFPMMAGGMGGGVIPMSNIYANALGISQKEILSQLVPAAVLGNVLAITSAALLAKFAGETKLSGHGVLVKDYVPEPKKEAEPLDYLKMGLGILVAMAFFILGSLTNYLIPQVHGYAFMIILVVIFKLGNFLPSLYQESAVQWGQFVLKNFTAALLVGIGMAINLNELIAALTPTYILICITSIVTVAFVSGLLGKLVGFYPLEASITAGLCTNSLGGTGNIAVLSAAKRLELIPFAQMATRIGGALVLILASFLINVLS